jgi:Cof subfamily protein (haloacid dehalogenase superfamily)
MTAPPPAPLTAGGRAGSWRPPENVGYVVCDVDGTLVGPDALASPPVIEAVAAAVAAGIRVGYATGRMRDAVGPLHTQVNANGPHVLHNGAEVRVEGGTIAAWPLWPEAVDALLDLARSRDDTYVEIYTESGYLASAMDERARPHWGILGARPRGVISRAAELDGAAVLKATFAAFDPDTVPEVVAAIEELGLRAGAAGSPITPGLVYVNATHPDADKGLAVTFAAQHLGISLSEVVAIGDAANDLSMLAVAGTAIAMGQADPEVRAAAHLVVPAVEADGVAAALDTIRGWNDRQPPAAPTGGDDGS